ncbi:hypothetical protein [Paenibacillus aceti]|uniref:Uncharacterized protein n=1 Tax=Paenibacillus aceti TaxID=1820010 RepID=A0ABQ1VQ16_9BACL|nr:hypothetical protein [Paenibacillus aceti]GGF87049.1 hypothetical protein GCM10010913_05660 [Paenibacillus aceti]
MLEYEFRLDDILEEMAFNDKKHFSPHYICALSGIADLKIVTQYLLSQVNRKLKVYYEVECPEGDSDFLVDSPVEIISELRRCSVCGIEYRPDPDRVWVSFDFLPQYKDYVKKKKVRQVSHF